MQWLYMFFEWLASPWTSQTPARRSFILWLLIHVLFVVLFVVVLAYVNQTAGLDNVVRTRWLGVNAYWLPLVFLLLYAVGWLVWGLLLLLGPGSVPAEFDDITAAWEEARTALEASGLVLSEVPVFLVLGKPGAELDTVFAAARVPLQVRAVPRQGPLQVFASREAVYVCCPGASLLPLLGERFNPPAVAAAPQVSMLDEYNAEVPAVAAEQLQPQAGPAVLLLGEPEPAPGEVRRPERASLLKDEEEVDRQARRLRQVCRLLAQARLPYCPANGVIVLLPLESTDTPADAVETAGVLRQDLLVARAAMQLDCPRLVVLCGAERLAGLARLAAPYQGEGPSRVLGQNFPLAPDVPPGRMPEVVEAGLGWVADDMLPRVVGGLMHREGHPDEVDVNAELYSFLLAMRERLRLLGRLAGRAVTADDGAPPMLAGAYVAGTGVDERQQAFLAGVLRRAADLQNAVRWTPDAVAEDSAFHWYALFGYALLAVFLAVVAALMWTW